MPGRSNRISRSYPRDVKGWVNASKYKPEIQMQFELLMIMDEEGREQQAWWDGTQWCFHPKRVKGTVIKWRFLEPKERCMNE